MSRAGAEGELGEILADTEARPPGVFRPCYVNKPGQREREKALGQGDRGGGGPEARAAEGNAGPAPFLASLAERPRWPGLFTRHGLAEEAAESGVFAEAEGGAHGFEFG